MDIKLGLSYRDVITGFAGVATAHAVYLTGCNQTLLNSRELIAGDTKSNWLDDSRLELIEAEAVVLPTSAVAEPGGPSLGPANTVQAPPRR